MEKDGIRREDAYGWVQRNALKSWDTGADFRELVSADPDIRRALSEKEIHAAFDLHRQLRNVDAVFRRVFG